ncbi:MAG: tyrosine--tRNA ligase [Chloroflexota bacterium]|nr:tyrosine--tRNA ligase [Chloroflexota bacterium]
MTADLLDDLDWRGLIAHSTDPDSLRAVLAGDPISFYCGFDPTAESLHFGNLVQLVTMRRLQLAGHHPIAVVGGATGLIGDPSGKSAERNLNEAEVVGAWVERIRGQVERYLAFDGTNAARIVNNLEWTAPLSALDFLREIGKHFSVNRMLDKESVSARLGGSGISFTEFSYQVLQALDYLELHRRHGCVLQTGGSDQWGNLTAGVDLIRRVTGDTVHALATPLITKADGTKHGKTAGGTLWLDPQLTSPYAFYQYFVNADDADVAALLKVFSFRSRAEIEALVAATVARPEAREAQQALAAELTTLVHGQYETDRVLLASRALFGQGELRDLDAPTLQAALAELPGTEVSGALPSVVDLMVATGLSESRSAARRAVTDGGAYVNNQRVTDAAQLPLEADLLHGRWLVLRRGRRTLARVERLR